MPDYLQCPNEAAVPHPGDYEVEALDPLPGARRYEYICYWCNALWPGEYVSEEAERADALEEARRLTGGDPPADTDA